MWILIFIVAIIAIGILGYKRYTGTTEFEKNNIKQKRYYENLPNVYNNKSRNSILKVYDCLVNISKLEASLPDLEKHKNNRSLSEDDIIKGMAEVMIYEQNTDKIVEYRKQVCSILGSFPMFPDLDIKYIESIL